MIRFISWALVSLFAIADSSLFVYQTWYKPFAQAKLASQEADELKLFTNKAMDLAKVKFSQAERDIKVNKIVSTAMNRIRSAEGRQSYITMLGIESGFVSGLKSPKGATGMAQLMPGLFLGFAKECNLKVVQADINNEDINLDVGACHFNQLLEDNEHNSHLAALAYNGGQTTADNFKKKKDIPHESALYLDNMVYYRKLAQEH